MTIKVPLKTVSICSCGYRLFRDEITVGTLYTVYPETADATLPFVLTCGGCRQTTARMGGIMAGCVLNPELPPGLLPLEVFDFSGAGEAAEIGATDVGLVG